MDSDEVEDGEVILEIESTSFKCNKQELSRHSDYFKAMFGGSFVEKDKREVELQGVDANAMNIILKLLWDSSYVTAMTVELFSVLNTSYMLQFSNIISICTARLPETLNFENCLSIWLFAERSHLKTLRLKAKFIALMEFQQIRKGDSIFEFNLEEVCLYLGSVNLSCNHEFAIFETAVKWWQNTAASSESPTDTTLTLIKLLRCLDFNKLTVEDIKGMIAYPAIAANNHIQSILACIMDIKENRKMCNDASIVERARKFLHCKSRCFKQVPCILANSVQVENESGDEQNHTSQNKRKLSANPTQRNYTDKYKRKRPYEIIGLPKTSISLLGYEYKTEVFFHMADVDTQIICERLGGFRMIWYKRFIFLMGGKWYDEKMSGWNRTVWAYDILCDRWERKTTMPFARKSFRVLLIDDCLFIVGGKGELGTYEGNMFSYNLKEDKWSELITMPPLWMKGIRCCCHQNQLLVISVETGQSYLYNVERKSWLNLPFFGKKQLHPDCSNCVVISYSNRILMKKDCCLSEAEVTKNCLKVSNCKSRNKGIPYCLIDAVLCDDIIYTLYGFCRDDGFKFRIETYCLDSRKLNNTRVIKDTIADSVIKANGRPYKFYKFRKNWNLIALSHYTFFDNEDIVNDSVI